jgi:transcriptional regulator with XRE-family HTH domain
MPWKGPDVRALRSALQLDQADFAKAVGVDPRTVLRWENGEGRPTGPAEAALNGIRGKLKKDPDSLPSIVGIMAGAVAFGGLSYLILKLFDALTEEGE